LVFRVYTVRGQTRGEQIGGDIDRAVAPNVDEYVLKAMPLGLHEIELTVMDDLDAVIGQGSIRHVITPGTSRTEKITIKRQANTPKLVDLPLSVRLVLPTENPPVVSTVALAWRLK